MKSAVKRNTRRILAIMLTICMVTSVSLPGVWAQDLTSGNYENSNVVSNEPANDTGTESEGETSPSEPSEPGDLEGTGNGDVDESGDGDIDEPGDVEEPGDIDEPEDSNNEEEGTEQGMGGTEEPGDIEEPGDLEEPEDVDEDGIEEFDEFDGFLIVDPEEFDIPEQESITRYDVIYDSNGLGEQYIDYGIPADDSYMIRGSVGTGISNDILILTGWNTKSDGSGTQYYPGDVISLSDYTVLYAQWAAPGQVAMRAASASLFSGAVEAFESTSAYRVQYIWSTGGFEDFAPANQSYYIKDASFVGINSDQVELFAWNTDSDLQGTVYYAGQSIPPRDMVLYGMFQYIESDNITVTYDGKGKVNIVEGATRGVPYRIKSDAEVGISPAYEGAVFEEWNTAPDGSGGSYYPGDTATFFQNIYLYAIYSPSFSVEYGIWYLDENNGKLHTDDIREPAGSLITLRTIEDLGVEPPEDHVFGGWRDTLSGELYDIEGWSFNIEGPLILRVEWTYIGDLYSVTYDANGGEGGTIVEDLRPDSIHTVLSDGIDGADVSRDGFEFVEWNTDQGGNGTTYMPDDSLVMTEDVILYAIWDEDDTWVDVTYHANDGSGESYIDHVQKGSYTMADGNLFSQAGYVIASWNEESDGSGQGYVLEEDITLTDDLEVYAVWNENPDEWADVTYHANDGTNTQESFRVLKGSYTMADGNLFSQAGYVIASWNEESDGSGQGYVLEEDITLTDDLEVYAVWNENPDEWADVTYHANDGTNTQESFRVLKGSYTMADGNLFSQAGYVIASWNEESDGSGQGYALEEDITLTDDLEVYAVWNENPDEWADVTYHANDGSGESYIDHVQKGSYTMADGNLFSQAGYVIASWNEESDGSGQGYVLEEDITLTDDLEVYAVWNENPDEWADVTYHANDGSGESYIDHVQKGSYTMADGNLFSQAGYVIASWNEESDGSGQGYALEEDITLTDDLEVYAVWNENPDEWADVTYHANDGSGESYIDHVQKGSYTMADGNLFSQAGYVIASWNEESDGSGQGYALEEDITLTDDLEVYAVWNENPDEWADVTYHANDGSGESYIDHVQKGSYTMADGNLFSQAGYVIASWNEESDGSGQGYVLEEDITLTDDLEVYAVWNENPDEWADVTYHANDGTNTQESFRVLKGSYTMADGNLFSQAGYVIASWNEESDGSGQGYALEEDITLTDDLEVYAVWNENPDEWADVTYHANDGSGESYIDHVQKGSYTMADGNLFSQAGYVIASWNEESDGSGQGYVLEEDITLTDDLEVYAVWNENPDEWADVTYHANDGSGESYIDHVQKGSYTMADGNLFSQAGYVIASWNEESDGSGQGYALEEDITLTDDLEVYAVWNENPDEWADVTYHANDGSGESYIDHVQKGSYTMADGNLFSQAGYVIASWNEESDGSGQGYVLEEDITLTDDLEVYAVWNENPDEWADVTYHANDGSGESYIDHVQKGSYTMADGNLFSQAGYVIASWNEESDGSGQGYALEEDITLTDDLEVYAVWNENPDEWADVTYHANDGSGESYIDHVQKGSYTMADGNLFSQAGYVIASWNEESDGSGQGYALEEDITLTDDLEVYAVWNENPDEWADVTYHANDGSGESYIDHVQKGSYTMADGNLFSQAGYVIASWNEESDGSGQGYVLEEDITLTDDLEVYAVWNENPDEWADVTYHANDGSGESYIDHVQKGSYTMAGANLFAMTGYVITEWNEDENGNGQGYTPEEVIALTDDLEVYAIWDIDENMWATFTYHGNGGLDDDGSDVVTEKVLKGQNAYLINNPFERDDYIFEGWSLYATGQQTPMAEGEAVYAVMDMNFYAQWAAEEVTVTYHANNGTGDSVTVDAPKGSYTMAGANLFAMTGYVITEWNEDENGNGQGYTPAEVIALTDDLEVYAIWDIDENMWATFTYHGNGGLDDDGSDVVTEKVLKGQNAYLINNPFERDDYIFEGWSLYATGQQTPMAEGEAVYAVMDMNFYAQWAAEEVTVTYHANNGTGDSVTVDAPKGSYTMAGANLFAMTGYVITEWNEDENGNGQGYTPEEVIALTDDLEVYAIWDIDENMWATFTYHGNGGLDDDGSDIVTEKVLKGQSAYLINNPFERDDYIFEGWSTFVSGQQNPMAEGEAVYAVVDMNFYAQWAAEEVSVTYHANNGTGDYREFSEPKGSYTMAGANLFAMTGYVITEWNEDENGNGQGYTPAEVIALTDDLEVYAIWDIDENMWATFTYHGNGGLDDDGSDVVTEKVLKGQNAYLINNPFERDDYIFEGWSLYASGQQNPMAEGAAMFVVTDIDIYAQWSAEEVTVTYHANNDTGDYREFSEPKGSYTMAGANLFTMTGYVITEWNESEDGNGQSYTPGQVTTLTDDLEVYAIWEKDPNMWATFTYYGNGGLDDDGSNVVTREVLKGQNAYLINNPFERNNHIFEGWSLYVSGQQNPMTEGETVYVVMDMNFYAQWAAEEVTVTYHANNSTGDYREFSEPKGRYTMERASLFTMTGYVITEWNESEDGNGQGYTPEQVITLTDDLEVYAIWDIDENMWATFTYHGNGGLDDDGSDVVTRKVLKGQNAYLINNPFERDYHIFEGWSLYTSGQQNPMAEGAPVFVVTDMDFYAQWTVDDNTFNVTYDPNADEYFGIVPTDDNDYRYDEYVEIKGLDPQEPLSRVGYRFLGWSTDQDADVPEAGYEAGSIVQIKGDITLYAVWQQDLTRYHVTYDGNLATGGDVPDDSTGYLFNEEVIVRGNEGGLYKYNFEFAGWSPEQNDPASYYVEGEKFRIQDNTTLYAVWDDNPVDITVTYHPNYPNSDDAIKVDGPYPMGYNYEIMTGDDAEISRSRYAVEYWSENPDGTGTVYEPKTSIILTEDLVLYAQWEFLGDDYNMLMLDANTGTGSTIRSGIYREDPVTLLHADEYGIYKLNNEFVRWTTERDGSGDSYDVGDVIYLDSDTILYAQWRYIGLETHSVIYTAGGGLGGPHEDSLLVPGESYIIKEPGEVGISMPSPILEFKYWVNVDDPNETFESGWEIESLDRTIVLRAHWDVSF